jgi:hypothetical protein
MSLGQRLGGIVVVALLLFPGSLLAEVNNLPRQTREHLFAGASNVQMLYSMKDLPPSVVEACARITPEHEFRLANPREKFQATDVIMDPNLPRRRLIWAAKIPGYYLLHYELGGIGLSRHVILVAYTDNKNEAPVTWAAAFFVRLKDYQEFLAALAAGKLDNDREYMH